METAATTIRVTFSSGQKATESVIPSQLGPVRLQRELGRGGMGCVWLGHHEMLAKQVAVKFLLGITAGEACKEVEVFIEGARAAAAVKHPCINAVVHADVSMGVPYLVMEFVDGPNLSEVLKAKGAMPARLTALALKRVCEAAAVLHEAGIVHRDIKPANVLVEPSGCLVLTDFGIAQLAGSSSSASAAQGMLLGPNGTPAYMAPEAFSGVGGPKVDVYAIGIMAFELLLGRRPIEGKIDVMRALHIEGKIDYDLLRQAGVPGPLIDFVERACNTNPLFRPKHGRQLFESLEKAIAEAGITPADDELFRQWCASVVGQSSGAAGLTMEAAAAAAASTVPVNRGSTTLGAAGRFAGLGSSGGAGSDSALGSADPGCGSTAARSTMAHVAAMAQLKREAKGQSVETAARAPLPEHVDWVVELDPFNRWVLLATVGFGAGLALFIVNVVLWALGHKIGAQMTGSTLLTAILAGPACMGVLRLVEPALQRLSMGNLDTRGRRTIGLLCSVVFGLFQLVPLERIFEGQSTWPVMMVLLAEGGVIGLTAVVLRWSVGIRVSGG